MVTDSSRRRRINNIKMFLNSRQRLAVSSFCSMKRPIDDYASRVRFAVRIAFFSFVHAMLSSIFVARSQRSTGSATATRWARTKTVRKARHKQTHTITPSKFARAARLWVPVKWPLIFDPTNQRKVFLSAQPQSQPDTQLRLLLSLSLSLSHPLSHCVSVSLSNREKSQSYQRNDRDDCSFRELTGQTVPQPQPPQQTHKRTTKHIHEQKHRQEIG